MASILYHILAVAQVYGVLQQNSITVGGKLH